MFVKEKIGFHGNLQRLRVMENLLTLFKTSKGRASKCISGAGDKNLRGISPSFTPLQPVRRRSFPWVPAGSWSPPQLVGRRGPLNRRERVVTGRGGNGLHRLAPARGGPKKARPCAPSVAEAFIFDEWPSPRVHGPILGSRPDTTLLR